MDLANLSAIPLESERAERVQWFVTLRWVVGLAMIASGLAAAAVHPPYARPLRDLGILVLAYNLVFFLTLRRFNPRVGTHVQIVLDWLVLLLLCIATGNLHSPFIFFFILHVVQAAIFLGRTECFLHGAFAVTLAAGMTRFTPAVPGGDPFRVTLRPDAPFPLETLLYWGAFSVVILSVIFISTSVTESLRRKQVIRLQLEESLRRANRELLEMDAARARFMRLTAHEIRGPLAATQSLLQVLVDGYAGDVSPKAMDLLVRAENRMLELIGLVNELLDLARGAQPPQEADREDVDLAVLLKDLVAELGSRAEGKRIDLGADIPFDTLLFRCDRQDLDRLFHNLLSNAVNYTPEGGRVRLSATITPTHGGGRALRVSVSDTGIGIPAADLPRIFEEFYRASNAKAEKKTGTGLGLAIVRKTSEKYGGTVEVASEPGKGTTFTVTLPV